MMAYGYKEKAKKLYGKAKEKYIIYKIAEGLKEIEKIEQQIARLEKGKLNDNDFDFIDLRGKDPDKG